MTPDRRAPDGRFRAATDAETDNNAVIAALAQMQAKHSRTRAMERLGYLPRPDLHPPLLDPPRQPMPGYLAFSFNSI